LNRVWSASAWNWPVGCTEGTPSKSASPTRVILSSTEGLGGSANLSYQGLSVNREADAMVPASLLPAAWAWGEALWGKWTPAD